ncbi:hypothetical protein P4H65_05900 [Paenibacillus chitinolyticus]|uniref:hypothetical protein n=1 Tax=Paenibacillus chitinolyticus TaxID=79263 RepID=UPI002DB591CE|nr:hypothetical protein [Paenibacillus chitinolyticus]MEC0245328.1 hypothetical protein [Paenibacillus chitinolyticus]
MKKYVIGFAVGAIVSASTAAYAGNTIQAVLFPAKYQVNGESKTLPDDYKTLNVDGHAYVSNQSVSQPIIEFSPL